MPPGSLIHPLTPVIWNAGFKAIASSRLIVTGPEHAMKFDVEHGVTWVWLEWQMIICMKFARIKWAKSCAWTLDWANYWHMLFDLQGFSLSWYIHQKHSELMLSELTLGQLPPYSVLDGIRCATSEAQYRGYGKHNAVTCGILPSHASLYWTKPPDHIPAWSQICNL